MILRKKRAFTLIELLVVIIVIMILATFVSISLIGTKKRSRDEKRISDVNNIGAALDQYALDHARQFPTPTATGSPVLTDYTLVAKVDSVSLLLTTALQSYLSPFPKDPSSASGADYGYDYVVRNDGLKAAIIVRASETYSATTKICNIGGTAPSLPYPASVNYYLTKPAGAISDASKGQPCYYVAK